MRYYHSYYMYPGINAIAQRRIRARIKKRYKAKISSGLYSQGKRRRNKTNGTVRILSGRIRKKVDAVFQAVILCSGYTKQELVSKARFQPLCMYRFIAQELMFEPSTITSSLVGDLFGRDHTTVLHAIDTVRGFLSNSYDVEFNKMYSEVKNTFDALMSA